MDWTILGIEETKDKKAITAAYRSRLVQVNPEDKPEEFKALRAAYEEAMRLADQEEEVPERDESPVGLWLEKARVLYGDFARRINPECWEELLADPVCMALDTRSQAEFGLLRFFMEEYFLPQKVWKRLDRAFTWLDRREELYEHFPREFIDQVIVNGCEYEDNLPYEMFDPGADGKVCDQYRKLYFRASRAEGEELPQLLEQMESLPERHPYGEMLSCRVREESGDAEQAEKKLSALHAAYPSDKVLGLELAMLCLRENHPVECEQLCRDLMERNTDNNQIRWGLAQSLAAQERFVEAKEQLYVLMDKAEGDQMRLYQLNKVMRDWNEKLIGRQEAAYQENPRDSRNVLELAWSYLQNDRADDAYSMAEHIDTNQVDQFDFHNLYAQLLGIKGEWESALGHLLVLEDVIRQMEPDGTEKTERRIRRLPEMILRQSECLRKLDREEEAAEKVRKAVEIAPNSQLGLSALARLQASQRNYEDAAQTLRELTRVAPGSYSGFLLLSNVYYKLRRDRDAFDAVNCALDLEQSDLEVYLQKMRILLRNGVWDQVHETLDFLRQHGISDELPVAWCDAQLIELEKKDNEKALEMYRAIAARYESGEELGWPADVYYRIANLLGEQLDAGKEEDRDQLMEILEKGLACDAYHADCLYFKAWLLKRGGHTAKALEMYHSFEKDPHHGPVVERNLAELYYRDLGRDAEKSLHYYRLLLEREDNADYCFYAGTCSRYLGDYAAAEADYLREMELAPEDVDAYNGLAYVYEAANRWEEALKQMEKAVAIARERKRDSGWLFLHKAKIERRLRRPQEAVKTVREAMERYNSEDGWLTIFEIYIQFGMWEEAKAFLTEWKTKKPGSEQRAAAIRLNILTGHPGKAWLGLNLNNLDTDDREDLELIIADCAGNHHKAEKIWLNRIQRKWDLSSAYMNLAQEELLAGKKTEAGKHALHALKLVDEELKKNKTDKALFRTRRAMILAVLGREKEAREELANARKLPLCEHCVYGGCKDADLFEAEMEAIFGTRQKAAEMFRAALAKWPDETDLIAGLQRLERKDS